MVAQIQPLPTLLSAQEIMGDTLASFFAGTPYGGAPTSPIDILDPLTLGRQLGRLLGPAYDAPDGSMTAADIVSLGAIITLSLGFNRLNLGEAFPGASVFALLPEWEAMLGLANGAALTTDARQMRLLARWRTRFAGTPQAILRALAPLSAGVTPTMRETASREVRANPNRVFSFTVRTSVDPNSSRIGPLDDVVQIMKPAISRVQFTDRSLTAGFFCDGFNDSVTDNTVLRI